MVREKEGFLLQQEAFLDSGLLPSDPSFTLPNLLKKMETTKTAQEAWFTMIMMMIVMLISYITVMVMAIKMMMIYT